MPRPRKAVKTEGPDEEDIRIAAETFQSYKDRLDDWRQLENKKKASIVRFCYFYQDTWNCLSSNCLKSFGSAPGLQYHLDRCGTEREKKRKVKVHSLPPPSELEPDEDAEEQIERRKRVPEIDLKSNAQAVELFLSYTDRLDDWRKLGEYDQNHILRCVYKSEKKAWKCLSSSCTAALSTPGGLCYHINRCGISLKDRMSKCSRCGEMVPKLKLPEHRANVHGHEAMYYLKPTPSRKKQKNALDDGTSDEDSSHADMLQDIEREKISGVAGTPTRRRRTHISLASISFKEYKSYMTRAYESFKMAAFGNDPEKMWDLFEDEREKAEWTLLDDELCDTYLPRFMDSIRFNVEGMDVKENILKRFTSIQTGKGFMSFCGDAITAVTWCPQESATDEIFDQYILTAVKLDSIMNISDGTRNGAILLWRLHASGNNVDLCYIIAHDFGTVMEIKWCPSGQWIPENKQLGAIAMTSVLGEVGIYIIPIPDEKIDTENEPKIFKPTPAIRLYSQVKSVIYTLDWSPFRQHDEIVAGLNDGTISVWSLKTRGLGTMLDEEGRLLPTQTIQVSNGPVREVQWWSESKVVIASLDRRLALWDLDTATCITRFATFQLASFTCLGSFLPAIVYGTDYTQGLHPVSILDFICSGVKCTMGATQAHSCVVWGSSINPWTGEFLTVDDFGMVCRICPPVLEGMFESKRRRFVEEVVLKSTIQRDNTEEVYSFIEARKHWRTNFTYSNKLPTKTEADKQFKNMTLAGEFPLNALFMVSWNTNKKFRHWACFGGQNGLLHIMNFETGQDSS